MYVNKEEDRSENKCTSIRTVVNGIVIAFRADVDLKLYISFEQQMIALAKL